MSPWLIAARALEVLGGMTLFGTFVAIGLIWWLFQKPGRAFPPMLGEDE